METGTTPFLHTESRGRLGLGLAAAAALIAWGYLSQHLPTLPRSANSLTSTAVSLALVMAIVWAMLPLTRAGRRLPLVALVGLGVGVLLVALGLIPLANVSKVIAGAALGLWLATEIQRVSWVVIIAAVASAVDVLSVAFGPTKEILEEGPVLIGYFTIAFAWFGYSLDAIYSAIGVSDVVFFALYLGCAAGFGLRPRLTAVAMVAALLVTFAVAMWWKALPALPMLSMAVIMVNIDRLRDDVTWLAGNKYREQETVEPAPPGEGGD